MITKELSRPSRIKPIDQWELCAHAPHDNFGDTIADALTQDFEGDYNDLMARIGDVIEEVQPGNVVIRAKLTDVETGQLKASGQGLFLPVKGSGTASLRILRD